MPACSAACSGISPAFMRSRAKLTTRTLLAVATPMHMIAPVSAGTLTVVCGEEQHPHDAARARPAAP